MDKGRQDFQNDGVRRSLQKRSPRETSITLVKMIKDNHSKSLEIDGRYCNKLRSIYSTKYVETWLVQWEAMAYELELHLSPTALLCGCIVPLG